MNLPPILSKRDLVWDVLIGASAFTALFLNFLGLLNGITVALPHLLYIPVVLAAYRYPRWGLFISGCIGGTYFLMVILLAGSSIQQYNRSTCPDTCCHGDRVAYCGALIQAP